MCSPEGNLPDAEPADNGKYGGPGGTASTEDTTPGGHLRKVFYRMGLNDEEIVALSGAHTFGRAYKDRSGLGAEKVRVDGLFGMLVVVLLKSLTLFHRPSLRMVAPRSVLMARMPSTTREAARGLPTGWSSTTLISPPSRTNPPTRSCSSCRQTRLSSRTTRCDPSLRSSATRRTPSSSRMPRPTRSCPSLDPSSSRLRASLSRCSHGRRLLAISSSAIAAAAALFPKTKRSRLQALPTSPVAGRTKILLCPPCGQTDYHCGF